MAAGGRPPKIGEEHWEILRAIVAERPTVTLAEIAAEVKRRVGIDAHAATIRKTLREAGACAGRNGHRASNARHARATVTAKPIAAGSPTSATRVV